MLFYKRIDKRKTVARAKAVLEEYARLKQIASNHMYDLDATSPAMDHRTFSGHINFDTLMIRQIDEKDRSYAEVEEYIEEIQKCINRLNEKDIEIINMKYVNGMSNKEIVDRLNSTGSFITSKELVNVLKEIYINFAISYGVYVTKSK